MISLEFAWRPEFVTCLGAHPDDIEIGAAGTLRHLATRHSGTRFHFIVLTGSDQRRREAEASALDLLGAAVTIEFGGFTENDLPYRDPARVKDFVRGAVSPETDLVMTPHRGDAHQDHRFVADLAGQVFRDHLILRYEIPKLDGDLDNPQVYVELSPEDTSAKLDHLERHFPSQHVKAWYARDVFAGLLRLRGVEARAASGFAEAFYVDQVRVA